MRFLVTSSLYYYTSGPSSLLCSIRCANTPGQKVTKESITTSRELIRSDLLIGNERNQFTRFEIEESGDLALHYLATARATFATIPLETADCEKPQDLEAKVIPYLFPSRYAPSDRLRSAAQDLFGGIKGKLSQVLAIEEWLFQHIYYAFGTSIEQSCARDTLELRTGVCRDFAHLGISFCRALSIPARYVTVYAYQLFPQDFHAVFEVYVKGIWYLVDGTRKAPLNGMIRISTGRDASDSAVASLFGAIRGQGLFVETVIAEAETEEFVPLYRGCLLDRGEMLYLE